MLLLSTFTPWLLLAFLGQQVSLSSAARNKNRGTVTASPGRAQRSGSKSAASGKGKFSITADKMQCTWAAKDVADAVRLTVKCENPEARIIGGTTDLECQYNGKPKLCPAYESNPQGFWKQVTRAFKRHQGKVCKDDRALVKAVMCKRAPRDVHFKLDIDSAVASAQSGGYPEIPPPPPPRSTSTPNASAVGPTGPTACQRKAEEHCSSSWASLCTFFFSMLQNDEC
ncbi:fibroblast growth factor-binding protein 1-like [Pagrus major]|uniref:fibroblast growth factor-binding protein 1-like n=1 Tax=Pagrus major TaxID=143350 RepID=UPI003CC85A8F